jgi:catechol 2,3-dioxygenase-like lactoylglutathione lyase family enzyme
MFDHVTIRASDRDASERFYDAVLATLGLDKTRESEHFAAWGDFSLAQESAEKPVTRRLQWRSSRRHVSWWTSSGASAPRPGTAATARPACGRSTRLLRLLSA